MEDLYSFANPFLNSSFRVDSLPTSFSSSAATADDFPCSPVDDHHLVQLGQTAEIDHHATDMSDLIKTQIASHPRYPNLVSAYIECQKVGAPPELASLLEEIDRVNHQIISSTCTEIGADPELDEFMESYCEVLQRYKEELSKPFDEATTFLSNMESQLNNLCNGAMAITRTADYHSELENAQFWANTNLEASDSSEDNSRADDNSYKSVYEAAGSSDEEVISCGEGEIMSVVGQEWSSNNIIEQQEHELEREQEQEQDIRGMLMSKYGGYLGSLRKAFLSKKKKGKLPKDARSALLDWWNLHYRWPYPTEEDKSKLSEMTGLDPKQINNWFVNQRKRHWKPSDDMRLALLQGLSANRSANSDHNHKGPTDVFQDI